jgi:ribosome recycling factor
MTLENTQEVEEMVNHKMDLTIENLKQDLSGIHAGRVSPAILESVKVDYYGNATPSIRLLTSQHLNLRCWRSVPGKKV